MLFGFRYDTDYTSEGIRKLVPDGRRNHWNRPWRRPPFRVQGKSKLGDGPERNGPVRSRRRKR